MPKNKAELLFEIIKKYANDAELAWIEQQSLGNLAVLQKAFVAAWGAVRSPSCS